MRCVALVGVALLTAACQMRDPYVSLSDTTRSGAWQIDRQTDRVTGATLPSAATMGTASSSNDPYPRWAQLQLTCFEKQPLVRFAFAFKVGSDKNSTLGYRFDDKPGHDSANSRILTGYTVAVIEDRAEVIRFVEELATSQILYVRIRSLNAGRTSAEFKLDGAPAAIAAGFADCPPTSPPPQPQPSRRTA